jgi:NADH-quinone oxidoreductase subunit F
VDLHLGAARATDAELTAIARVIDSPVHRTEGERVVVGGAVRAAAHRHLLLPGLWALQDATGWVSPGGLAALCDALAVPPAEAYGVASFYDLLHTEPPPDRLVRVCDDVACAFAGTGETFDDLPGERVASPCLGQCDRGAAALVQDAGAPLAVHPGRASVPAVAAPRGARLLRRILGGEPVTTVDAYRAAGGFAALARAIEIGGDAVIDEVEASGLLGRGGAAFPTGGKWRAVASQPPGPKHVVANADESEPGTFKDRVLMEQDPFALVEALTICGLAVGATQGWVYVRGEYPRATSALTRAIADARAAGVLGASVLGSRSPFDIELRRGAGAYVCGEETALLESIEGYRGEPRNKPPYPTTHGLFGRPTVINNVETLINVLDVLDLGADAWRTAGTERSPGTRLFCLSGHVAHPGVYEQPMGVSLREVITDAGGVAGHRELQAVLLGGAAGTLAFAADLDVELSFEGVRERELTLGSGVVMVFDDTVDLRAVVRRAARFFAHESCGQCVPCRVGTQRQVEVLDAIDGGDAGASDLLDDLDRVMTDASICGLGQAAALLVRSARRAGVLR